MKLVRISVLFALFVSLSHAEVSDQLINNLVSVMLEERFSVLESMFNKEMMYHLRQHRNLLDLFGNGVRNVACDILNNIIDKLVKDKMSSRAGLKYGRHFSVQKFGTSMFYCALCQKLAFVLQKIGKYCSSGVAADVIKSVCIRLKLAQKDVCEGICAVNQAHIVAFLNRFPKSSDVRSICKVALQTYDCFSDYEDITWEIAIPQEMTKLYSGNVMPQVSKKPLEILHITDVHYDETYSPYSNFECGRPICCSYYDGWTGILKRRAGYWGDYHSCDIPWHTVVSCLNHSSGHNVDLVYFTGDVISHRVWNTSMENNIAVHKQMFEEMKRAYGDRKVYPVIGNHDMHPANLFAPDYPDAEYVSPNLLYKTLAELWKPWLPNSALETVAKGGYYTVRHSEGFRIIALNNIVAYAWNWWLFIDRKDPLGQLQWLVGVLAEAERNEESVHLLYHCPTGQPDIYAYWSAQFRKIVLRFRRTIKAHFVGHTHLSEFHLFYDDQEQPQSVVFNGGSVTTYEEFNPNYRIYKADGATLEIQDYDEWAFNVTAANEAGHPEWQKLYSFREEFEMASLRPYNFHQLIVRIVWDERFVYKYHRATARYSDGQTLGCGHECRGEMVCRAVTSVADDRTMCEKLWRD